MAPIHFALALGTNSYRHFSTATGGLLELSYSESHYWAGNGLLLWEAPMAKGNKMEEYANELIRLAGLSSDPIIREQMLKMARQWKEAASGSKQQQASEQVAGCGFRDSSVAVRLRERHAKPNAPPPNPKAPPSASRTARPSETSTEDVRPPDD